MNTPLKVNGQDVVVSGTVLKVARLEHEWYDDVDEPRELIAALSGKRPSADILTFWQRLPDVEPKHPYYTEWEEVAALPVSTYDHWWNTQIKSRTRGLIRKGEKQGITVQEAQYTDDFVRGMTRIFNEAPMRQGRPFLHYGKDFDTIKREFSRYLFRELLIGAYFEGELIGFMMIGMAGKYAVTGQIISMIRHRDKGPTNCLVAKAVEICAREKIPYLVYLHWSSGSLAEFKRRNGFEKTRLPRYFVPLTAKGRLALRLGVHKGVLPLLPETTVTRLKQIREQWYQRVYALRHPKMHVQESDS